MSWFDCLYDMLLQHVLWPQTSYLLQLSDLASKISRTTSYRRFPPNFYDLLNWIMGSDRRLCIYCQGILNLASSIWLDQFGQCKWVSIPLWFMLLFCFRIIPFVAPQMLPGSIHNSVERTVNVSTGPSNFLWFVVLPLAFWQQTLYLFPGDFGICLQEILAFARISSRFWHLPTFARTIAPLIPLSLQRPAHIQ